MITVTLDPGETIRVEFADSDGSFVIDYGPSELTVTSDLPGSHLGGEGVIYREVFAGCTCARPHGYHMLSPAHLSRDPKCPTHGDFSAKALDRE